MILFNLLLSCKPNSKYFQIHIGGGHYIDLGLWRIVKSRGTDSAFVRQYSRAVWGTETLINRAVNEDRISIRYRDRSPRRHFTEQELNFVKGK